MAEKRRYTVSLPDHVADAVETLAPILGATPTEYVTDIIRWWFGQGCPPVTPDEIELRKFAAKKLTPEEIKRRLLPIPPDIDVWQLDPEKSYIITEDPVVRILLNQLGLPNLFAQASEHDEARFMVAFDNHPTHWLTLDFFKGSSQPGGNGLAFTAYPKASTSRKQMLSKLTEEARKIEAKGPVHFSQLPTPISQAAHR